MTHVPDLETIRENAMKKRELPPAIAHQWSIAMQTLRMNDTAVLIMGGMNKDEARAFLRSVGYSAERIARIETAQVQS